MLNTSEVIREINKSNDSKQNLGDGDKSVHRQEKNGVDILCPPLLPNSPLFENFDRGNYVDEMTEYENAINEYEKSSILKKYQDIAHEINQPTQNRPSGFAYSAPKLSKDVKIVPELHYESMYNDKVCTFFIGSVTAVGLYIVYKMME